MGSGASSGIVAGVKAASDEELRAAVNGLSPEARAKLMASAAATEESGSNGKLTIRSGTSGDVITVMENVSDSTRVLEVLQKLCAERPPPKSSVYHFVLGEKQLPRKSTLRDCGLELDGEVLLMTALLVSDELQAKRDEALKAVDDRAPPYFGMDINYPPESMMCVCAAICCLFDIAPGDGHHPPMKNYWQPCKDAFTSMREGWLEKLDSFKPELAEDVNGNAVAALARIQEYIEHPHFKPEEVTKDSFAFELVCAWVLVQVEILQELSSM